MKTIKEFDYDSRVNEVIHYLNQDFKKTIYTLTEEEQDVFETANKLYVKGPEKTKKLEFAIKVWKKMPNKLKKGFLKIKQYIEILDGLEKLRNE